MRQYLECAVWAGTLEAVPVPEVLLAHLPQVGPLLRHRHVGDGNLRDTNGRHGHMAASYNKPGRPGFESLEGKDHTMALQGIPRSGKVHSAI